MKFIPMVLGIILVFSGVLVLFSPEILSDAMENNLTDTSLYKGAILVRSAFGILLVYTAKISKYPRVIKFFGYLALLTALTFIIIGHDRFQDFMSAAMSIFEDHSLITGLFVMVFGGFLSYAFSGKEDSGE